MAPAKTGKESNYNQAVTKMDQTKRGNFSMVIKLFSIVCSLFKIGLFLRNPILSSLRDYKKSANYLKIF
jgi:hypothetical protein